MTETNKRITPSELTECLIKKGYNADLSAPMIANVYLQHVHNGILVPGNWEKQTIKDVEECYYNIN